MIQFFAPDILRERTLPPEESVHCCRVLRKKDGDEIYVTDGKGHRFRCIITESSHSSTKVEIIEEISELPGKDYSITLGVAPTKNPDRMEWLTEKAVELGVDRIVLLRCAHSERKVMKSDRLRKIMVSAMKQSLSVTMPELIELTEFHEFIDDVRNEDSQKFMGYCSEMYPRRDFAKECQPGNNITIIGPEGDFTEQEVAEAVKAGFIPVSFGNRRLRTETAGVFAISCIDTINQRLK